MTLKRYYRPGPVALGAIAAMSLLLAGGAGLDAWPRGAQHARRKAPVTKPVPAAALTATPFHAGEWLLYHVVWSKYAVSAGNVKLSVLDQRDFFGHAAWHFQAVAHSMDTMRLLYPLDDQFDSYTNAAGLASLQYEMYLNEQKKEQKSAWRMSVAGGAPDPANVTAATVPPGTYDPIGLLYALRAADWKSKPTFRAPVFDGHNLYDVAAQMDPAPAPVSVPAGQFMASRITIRVFEHGQEMSGTHFTLWLAQDAAHTPILIEAEIPFGTARVELSQRS
jgi:hypothetical protein